jgi:hypothetical protein
MLSHALLGACRSLICSLTDEQWDDGLALKFHSARRLTIAAWDVLKASHGSVAITSGTSAYTPKASLAAVSTINAAILALAKAFADRAHWWRRSRVAGARRFGTPVFRNRRAPGDRRHRR